MQSVVSMRAKALLVGALWCGSLALVLALGLAVAVPGSAAALSLGDYFSYSFTVEFNTTSVAVGEGFSATVQAEATCTNDLPVSASEAQITGRIVAEHQSSGVRVTLNSSYSIAIDPFPSQKDDTTEITQVVSLVFPEGSPAGTYTVIAELIEATVTVIFPISVTTLLPPSQTVGSIILLSSGTVVGGAVGGGGGGGGGLTGVTSVVAVVNDQGRFGDDVTAQSADKKVELDIPRGTIGKNRMGSLISHITIKEAADPPSPPENSEIIGVVYDVGPDGCTFDPPITITVAYDESLLPEGIVEESLLLAVWDEAAGEWVVLTGSTVHPDTDTITAPVSHFSAFAILHYARPAAFVVSELSIAPAEADAGGEITISVLVANTGDVSGHYRVTLRIDNAVMATREVTLDGGASQMVAFTVTEDVAGTYAVDVEGLSGVFRVLGPAAFVASGLTIAPAEVGVGEEVTIGALITNTGDVGGRYKVTLRIDNTVVATREVALGSGVSQPVTFTAVKPAVGTYAVDVEGLSGTFVVREPPAVVAETQLPATQTTPATAKDWWYPGGLIAAGAVLVVVVLLIAIRLLRRG